MRLRRSKLGPRGAERPVFGCCGAVIAPPGMIDVL